MKVVIVGGGLGGLALAAVFDKMGHENYELLEEAPNLREAGAGIQIPPNAMQVLAWLGLKQAVLDIGHMSYGNIYRRIEDDSIVKYVLTGKHLENIYGTPVVQVNRQDLASLLEKNVRKGAIRYSAKCVNVLETSDGMEVELENGERITADIVVGADGIHSKVRTKFFGAGEREHATAAWRALIPKKEAEDIPLAKWSHVWFGDHRSVVAYWVGGGQYLNFVGSVQVSESTARDWRTEGSIKELRKIYSGVSPLVEDLVSRIKTAFVTDIYVSQPLETFVTDKVALIGDAAHPMMPYLAAGAGQAIEDAFALGVSLTTQTDPLTYYDHLRCGRGNSVQAASQRMSSLYHGTARSQEDVLGTGFESSENSVDVADFREWLWGYDIVEAAGMKH